MPRAKTKHPVPRKTLFLTTKRPTPRTVAGFRPTPSPKKSDLLVALRELDLHRTELQSQNDELHRTQLHLESSRERFAQLYHDAPVGYLTLSLEGHILEANLSLSRLLKTPIPFLIGTPLHQWVDPRHQDTLHFHLQTLRSKLDAGSCKLELLPSGSSRAALRSDTPIAVQLQSRPFQPDPAAPRQFLIAIVDVSERELLQREILHTSELERLRVASELHDGICQEIVGLELLLHCALKALPPSLDTSSFSPVLAGLRHAAEHARQLAHFTNPAVACDSSVTDALKKLASRTQHLYGTACSFSSAGSSPGLDPATGSQLLRMVQEAVCNAVKHSRATRIQIALRQSKTFVQLTVSDDGCGFQQAAGALPSPQKSEGLGLRIMQHRASLIGARFALHSEPGGGTVVRFSLDRPLEKRAAQKKKNAGRKLRPASLNS